MHWTLVQRERQATEASRPPTHQSTVPPTVDDKRTDRRPMAPMSIASSRTAGPWRSLTAPLAVPLAASADRSASGDVCTVSRPRVGEAELSEVLRLEAGPLSVAPGRDASAGRP